MQITVNGKPVDIPNDCTILSLLAQLDMTTGRLAVELNTEIVPRSQHGNTNLKQGDAVEIVHAIGGG